MIELKHGPRTVDLPYSVRLFGVDEAQFLEMADEDSRAELLDGVMIVHSPATIEHDYLGSFVRALMRLYARRRRLGTVLGPDSLVHLKSGRLFAPDAYFVDKKRSPSRKIKRFEGAPNLVDFLAVGEIAFQGHEPAARFIEILALNGMLGMGGQETSHLHLHRRLLAIFFSQPRSQVERSAPVLGVGKDAELVNLDVLQFRAQRVHHLVPFIPVAHAAEPGRFVEANDRGQNLLRRLEHLQAR